jgi:hypothetical protein
MPVNSDILSINALFDIRAEALAAALLARAAEAQEKLDVEQVIVAPQGTARRRSNREVKAVRKKQYEQDTVLFIEIHRKGLFDTLPEGLFLRLNEEYDSPLIRTRAIAQQIKDARKFFLPFEQALYLPRIEAEGLEQEWTERFPHFIEEIWGLPNFADCLDSRQRFLLCHLLPEAYRITGNWELTGLCFEAVLQKPVDLRFIAPLNHPNPDAGKLGEGRLLGVDSVLGESFRDDMPALEVSIKGVTALDLPDFMEGGKKLRILRELLYTYLLPLDIAIVTQIIVTEDAWSSDLGEGYLGYNLRLQALPPDNSRTQVSPIGL